ncbi:MAG TPA: ubiquinone biosynthesis hydroxylase [Xanthobacteraceae bacterium]|nr:ubiquinone biosynthesis hydroxylase [Xanthobacteraceae bacterium]
MDASNQRLDVLIAGAGIAGLALATALVRALKPGFSIAVCDPALAKEPARDERVSAIAPAARQILEALGVWEKLAANAQPVRAMEITDSHLEDAVRQPFLHFDAAADAGAPLAHIAEHRELAIALREAAAKAGVRLLASKTESFAPLDGGLDVRLEDGASFAVRLLVAADGAKSKLRATAGIRMVSWDYGQSGIVATIGHERDHEGRAVQHFLPVGTFAILPLTGRRSSIVWAEKSGEAERLVALAPAEFKEELIRRFGLKLGEIEFFSPPRAYPLSFAVARRFVGERLALVGDAAHVIHPLAGQGLNLGLRDVAALAECVADAARLGLDPGAPDVLARYERWRRLDTMMMAGASDGLNRLFSNRSDALRVARDVGLGIVERTPALKRYFSREAAGETGEMPKLMRGEGL